MTYALLKPSPRAAAKPARPAKSGAAGKVATKPDVGVDSPAHDDQNASASTHAPAIQVQTKLTVGSPNDPLEHEADRVADAIVANLFQPAPARRRHSTTTRATTPTADAEPDTIHQKPAGPAPDIARAHAPRISTASPAPAASVTATDTLQRACDECSEESDEVEIQRAPNSTGAGILQRSCSECSEEPEPTMLPVDTGDGTLQRSCATCSDESEEVLQRAPDVAPSQSTPRASGQANPTLSSGMAHEVRTASRGGTPLPAGIRSSMEASFGADFSPVKIHTDAASHRLNHQLHARAFTLGPDIFFAANQFRPTERAGQHLLAHELTHTIQQRHGLRILRRAPDGPTSSEYDTAEAVLDSALYENLDTNQFEERVRRLSRSERNLLRDLISSTLWDDNATGERYLNILERVVQGHTGGTTNTPNSVPCEPGDVDTVQPDEWFDAPIITDLELFNGQGVAKGKFGAHSPQASVHLFQRALVQWGCEMAVPARNPLPKAGGGVDGLYGPQFRNAVRIFQREEGLSADGTAGPATIQRMASRLHGANLRREVDDAETSAADAAEAAAEQAAGEEQLAAEQAETKAAKSFEDDVQRAPLTSKSNAQAFGSPVNRHQAPFSLLRRQEWPYSILCHIRENHARPPDMRLTLIVAPSPPDASRPTRTPVRTFYRVDDFAAELRVIAPSEVSIVEGSLADAPPSGFIIFFTPDGWQLQNYPELGPRVITAKISRRWSFLQSEKYHLAATIPEDHYLSWSANHNNFGLTGRKDVVAQMGLPMDGRSSDHYIDIREFPYKTLPELLMNYLLTLEHTDPSISG